MFDSVESFYTFPIFLHFFCNLEYLGFFYLEISFVYGFVLLFDILESFDGKFTVSVYFNMMWVAEKQQITISSPSFIRLGCIISATPGQRCLDVAQLSNKMIFKIE